MTRLKELYTTTLQPALTQELTLKNIFQAPRLEKVILNVGIGEAKDQTKVLEEIVANITKITGQKAVVTKAHKSIAGFKIRAGQSVGVRVTLRGERMYDFLDKLINIALPRLRDFRGLSRKGFDGKGNYNLGVREQIIFPEIHFDAVEKVHGMNISIVTTAQTNEQAEKLLAKLGFPFEKQGVT